MFTRFAVLLILFAGSFSQAALQCKELFVVETLALDTPTKIQPAEIQQMLKHSRDGSREKTVRRAYREFFSRVFNQPVSSYAKLSASEALDYLSLLAQWRFLPPEVWNAEFLKTIESHLDTWTPRDYLTFALQRKLTPLELPGSFLQHYRKNLRDLFGRFDTTTQLETFSTELYHGSKWGVEDLAFFVVSITQSLQTKSGKLQIKPLKETYRALFFLTASERQTLAPVIQDLIVQLDNKLADYGLALADGGVSGSKYSGSTTTDPRYVSLVMDLHMLYPRAQFKSEFSNPEQQGFFDPVDLLIVEPRLVIEWDGAHHYFRKMDLDGTVHAEQGDLVLRPADQARDRILRASGYRILRISPPVAKQLDFIDIPALIKEQNPESPPL